MRPTSRLANHLRAASLALALAAPAAGCATSGSTRVVAAAGNAGFTTATSRPDQPTSPLSPDLVRLERRSDPPTRTSFR